MKRVARIIGSGYLVAGILILIGAVAFAASILFFTQHKLQHLRKDDFALDMNIASNSSAVGPDDTVAFTPTVHNDATEQMYSFLN